MVTISPLRWERQTDEILTNFAASGGGFRGLSLRVFDQVRQGDVAVEVLKDCRIVGYHDQGGIALPGGVAEKFDRAALVLRIEVAGRFVGENQCRLRDQCSAQCQPLALALGEVGGALVEQVSDACGFRQRRGAVAGAPVQGESRSDAVGKQDVVAGAQIVEQLEVLKDHADVANAKVAAPAFVENGDVLTGDRDFARRGDENPGDQAEQGGFPTAGRTDNGERFAILGGEFGNVQTEALAGVVECCVAQAHAYCSSFFLLGSLFSSSEVCSLFSDFWSPPASFC